MFGLSAALASGTRKLSEAIMSKVTVAVRDNVRIVVSSQVNVWFEFTSRYPSRAVAKSVGVWRIVLPLQLNVRAPVKRHLLTLIYSPAKAGVRKNLDRARMKDFRHLAKVSSQNLFTGVTRDYAGLLAHPVRTAINPLY